jgi:hypothetical protein
MVYYGDVQYVIQHLQHCGHPVNDAFHCEYTLHHPGGAHGCIGDQIGLAQLGHRLVVLEVVGVVPPEHSHVAVPPRTFHGAACTDGGRWWVYAYIMYDFMSVLHGYNRTVPIEYTLCL